MTILWNLLLALALGLLIGAERGWETRTVEEGQRLAGIRTFGLISILGALWALLAADMGEILLAVSFASFAALLIVSHIKYLQTRQDHGLTTLVAALITFALGALTVRNQQFIAASMAVITAFLLSLKPVLHDWLKRIEQKELFATLKLLLISVVLLPVLPNKGYGPWAALNPYEIWWLVVLIVGISFFGYIAVRLFGTGKGTLLTGLFGGLTSSTATTIHFARLAQQDKAFITLAAGALIASATMFPRMLLEVSILNYQLFQPMLIPMGCMAMVSLLCVAWLWRMHSRASDQTPAPVSNPFQLLPAIKFGLLLSAVMLLTSGLYSALGEKGIYLAAGISGIADVDAITLSITRMTRDTLDLTTARNAITLVAIINTLMKGALAAFIGGWGLARYLLPALIVVAISGGVVVWLTGDITLTSL